jgi:hypothetical protein
MVPTSYLFQFVMKRFACFRHSPAKLEQRFAEKRIYGGHHDDKDFGSSISGVGFDGLRVRH